MTRRRSKLVSKYLSRIHGHICIGCFPCIPPTRSRHTRATFMVYDNLVTRANIEYLAERLGSRTCSQWTSHATPNPFLHVHANRITFFLFHLEKEGKRVYNSSAVVDFFWSLQTRGIPVVASFFSGINTKQTSVLDDIFLEGTWYPDAKRRLICCQYRGAKLFPVCIVYRIIFVNVTFVSVFTPLVLCAYYDLVSFALRYTH